MGNVGRKSTLSRPSRKCYDIIEIDSQEVGCGRMDWIGLGQDREIGKLGEKRPLSKPRGKWVDINEIDIQEVACGRMDCIWLCQDI